MHSQHSAKVAAEEFIYLFKIEIVHESTQRKSIVKNYILSLPIRRQIQHNSVQLMPRQGETI